MLTKLEMEQYKTACLLFFSKEYKNDDGVMQLHYGCKRDNNQIMYQQLGPDTGYDCINNYAPAEQLTDFLNAAELQGGLPRTNFVQPESGRRYSDRQCDRMFPK